MESNTPEAKTGDGVKAAVDAVHELVNRKVAEAVNPLKREIEELRRRVEQLEAMVSHR
jgi:polyhydroxyalkanoate synthesis regulator phasin